MNKPSSAFILLVLGGFLLIGVFAWQRFYTETSPLPGLSSEILLPAKSQGSTPSAPAAMASLEIPAGSPISGLPLLGPHLQKIGECLHINNTLSDTAELSFAALNASLQNELGGLLERHLDWRNTHLTLSSGEKRRLRLEVEAVSEERSARRLKYFAVDAEDLPVPLPLREDQSLDPSESFIASLEGEGAITLREEAHRGLYAQGSEFMAVERNGILTEFELIHLGRSVKCQQLDTPQGDCRCF